MRELLENVARDALIDFICEYAEYDEKFANALHIRFQPPEIQSELTRISKTVDFLVDGIKDDRKHDRWGWYHFDLSDIYREVEERLGQGHIKLAFSALVILYCKLLEVFEYQGECEANDEAEYCLDTMAAIVTAHQVKQDDQQYIFDQCIKLAYLKEGKDYGADFEDQLLGIAARYVTHDNRFILERAISLFEDKRREEEFQVVRLKIVSTLDTEQEIACFLAENIHHTKIREFAFDHALNRQNYDEAERLCLEIVNEQDKRDKEPWLRKLYSLYEMLQKVEKQFDIAERLLLGGNLEFYDKLKSHLIRENQWKTAYPLLLDKCAQCLSSDNFMTILYQEKEFDLLLVRLKNSRNQIYTYGPKLSNRYREDIDELFRKEIQTEAERARDRQGYQRVCAHLREFVDAGYSTEVSGIIDDFKVQYKRKPAFVVELTLFANTY